MDASNTQRVRQVCWYDSTNMPKSLVLAVPQAIRICVTGPVTLEEVVKGLELIRDELDSGLSHHLKVF